MSHDATERAATPESQSRVQLERLTAVTVTSPAWARRVLGSGWVGRFRPFRRIQHEPEVGVTGHALRQALAGLGQRLRCRFAFCLAAPFAFYPAYSRPRRPAPLPRPLRCHMVARRPRGRLAPLSPTNTISHQGR